MPDSDLTSILTEQAERAWVDWQVAAVEQGVDIPADAGLVAELKRVFEASEFVACNCVRQPALLVDLLISGDLHASYPTGRLGVTVATSIENAGDEAALATALRRLRRREMLRIAWRDLAGIADLEQTLEDLSALADSCVDLALERLYAWTCAEYGTPRDLEAEPQRLVVLGMGKLGARELNFSSDIDLIFAFPKHGETDGPRPLANEQFFTRLCQRLIKAIGAQQAEGFVFRVDTRLRPFGDSGPMVMSFDAMEDYYQSQAREWERYAMVKARVIAGDRAAGERLMGMLRPFVYRRYLDFGAFENLREMKALISRELLRKGLKDNVKLGPGGIREVEFIGQVFQLVRGGRKPELQERRILAVLQLLGERGYLPGEAVIALDAGYRFLRRVENRLQAWADRQTHDLPADDQGRLRLARSMGYADWAGFETELVAHRERVQAQFEQVFAAPETEADADEPDLAAVWLDDPDAPQAGDILASLGFEAPAEVLSVLEGLRNSRACRSLSSRGRERLNRLMPLLLKAVGETAGPDIALARLLTLVEAVVQRSAYLSLLSESPQALTQLARLACASPWIAGLLTRYPLLLDELLDNRRLYEPLRREALVRELDGLLAAIPADDLEAQMDRLRQFAQSNALRVASADITGAIPIMVVSDYLTEIAEVVLAKVLEQAWGHLEARHGRPSGVADDSGFLIVAYGKLGGIELGYGSDLDLVFLHGGGEGMTDGERPLADGVFFARLGQRIIHMLTTRTPVGTLYEVDMRLRPNGAAGLLVSGMQAFTEYQRDDAWTWEHQALVRARVVAGDPALVSAFEVVRHEVLAKQRDSNALRGEVRDMRVRMRGELDKSGQGRFDLKQGAGGIADIEFMVQYAVLRWSHEHPELLEWTDNIRLLETLSRLELFAAGTAEMLADAYRTFRAAAHRNTLQDSPALVSEERFPELREGVKQAWADLMEE